MRPIFVLSFILLFANTSYSQTRIDTLQLIRNTVKLFDLDFTEAEADSMVGNIVSNLAIYRGLHLSLPKNNLPYPFAFNPLPFGEEIPTKQEAIKWSLPAVQLPANKNELAFYSLPQLASLIKNKKISSVELTRFF